MLIEQQMVLEACMDRSGDDARHEAMKDLLLEGAKEIERLREALGRIAKLEPLRYGQSDNERLMRFIAHNALNPEEEK